MPTAILQGFPEADREMRKYVKEIFAIGGMDPRYLKTFLIISDEPEVPPAFTNWDYSDEVGVPEGFIFFDANLFNTLSHAARKFAIYHESAHIILKHIKKPQSKHREIESYMSYFFDKKLPKAGLELARQEAEADAYALKYARNFDAFMEVINEISGGNMDTPSHYFAVMNQTIPAFPYGERVRLAKEAFDSF